MANEQGPVCVSVINMKGGVGKTTIAAMLARYATWDRPFELERDYERMSLLAIDLDPQANLSQAFMSGYAYKNFLEDRSPSIVEVFKEYQPPTSDKPSPGPLNIRDAVHSVGGWGSNLDIIPSRFDFSDHLIDSIKPDPRVLARLIASNFQDKDSHTHRLRSDRIDIHSGCVSRISLHSCSRQTRVLRYHWFPVTK